MWFIMHHCPFSSKVIHCTLPCVKRHSLIRFAEGYGGELILISMDIFWVQVESDWSVVPGVLLHIIHFRHEMDEISRHPTRTWLIGWVITSLQMFTVLYLYISTTNYEIYIYISWSHSRFCFHLLNSSEHSLDVDIHIFPKNQGKQQLWGHCYSLALGVRLRAAVVKLPRWTPVISSGGVVREVDSEA